MRGAWVCVVISCVHDVMNSGGEMWDRNGGCFELDGCMHCRRVRAVPGAMMVKMLDWWKGRRMDQVAPNSIEKPCERVCELVSFGVVRVYWNTQECSEKGLYFRGGCEDCDGEVGGWLDVCG